MDEKVECVDGLATVVEGDANQTFRCSNVRSVPSVVLVQL